MPPERGSAAIVVRDAEDADLAEIQLIYAHHVATGPGSFEEIPPDLAEIERRRAALSALDLPFLVAASGDRVLGFAYAGPHTKDQ